jgi:alpha-glucosidase
MHLGKYTWDPTRPGEHSRDGLGATTRNTRDYIDFAARHGFDAVLVEGWNKGWARDWVAHASAFSFTEPNAEFDLEAMAAYAKSKAVGLIAHHETGAVIENYERQVEAAFAQCQRLGIHHVKSGYVGMEPRVIRRDADGHEIGREYLDGQYMVRHYRKIVELAAKHQIMMDVHESIKDTGESRTWPNMMTRESARGQEFNAWAGDGGNPPRHDVDLFFTRCLAGPFDFTPGVLQVTFPDFRQRNRVNTTVAKQLALYVVFYSPLHMAADLPEHYAEHRELFRFIVDVPTDWEESRFLAGEMGKYAVIARRERGGDQWFLGAITDQHARTLRVPLAFLPKKKRFVAAVYRDGQQAHWSTNPFAYEILEIPVDSTTHLELNLAPGGGQAIRLRAAPGGEEAAPRF